MGLDKRKPEGVASALNGPAERTRFKTPRPTGPIQFGEVEPMPRQAIGTCLACKSPIWTGDASAMLPDGRRLHTKRAGEPERLGCRSPRDLRDTPQDIGARWIEALIANHLASPTSHAVTVHGFIDGRD